MQKYVYDDFGSGNFFLVEYQTADRRKLTQRDDTKRPNFGRLNNAGAIRGSPRSRPALCLTEQERQRILAGILDTDEAGTDPAEIQNRPQKKPTLHPTKRTAPTFESRTAKAAPILIIPRGSGFCQT